MNEKKPTMETLVVPSFVVFAIVEHAKRRRNSAGYLLGDLSCNQINVTDYIPFTHESTTDVCTRAYEEELRERISVKKYYSPNITPIGWYAAGAPETENEKAFDVWCKAPGAFFSRIRQENRAVMLLGRMPTTNDLRVRWEAQLTCNTIQDSAFQCVFIQELVVSVGVETQSMNVLLSEIMSKTLYNGGKPYPTSRVTNLDYVAMGTGGKETDGGKKESNQKETESRPLETALLNVQNKLHQTITHACAVLSSANNRKVENQKECAEIVKNYEAILEDKNQQNGRDGFITESYKDALMIKYTAALLRRHVMDIERHSRYEVRERGHNNYSHGASPTGPRKNAAFR